MDSTPSENGLTSTGSSEPGSSASADGEWSSSLPNILEHLYRNSPNGIFATISLGTMLLVSHWSVLNPTVLLGWWGALAALTLGRILLVRSFRHAPYSASPSDWFHRQLLGVGLSGMLWGIAGVLLFTPNSVTHQAILAVIIAGLIAGAIPTFSASRMTYLLFALPATIPILIRFALVGDLPAYAIATVGLIFLGAMTWQAWINNQQVVNLLTLRSERNRAEQDLITLFESTHDLIQSVAPDGKIITVNRAWLEALGYTEAETPALNIFDVLHPDSHAHCMHFMQRILAGEDMGSIEITFQSKSGRLIIAEGRVHLHKENGHVSSTRGIFRDITHRKAAELTLKAVNANLEHLVAERTDKLQESEALTKTVLNTLSSHIAVLDKEGIIIDINESWTRFARENGGENTGSLSVGANYLAACIPTSTKKGDTTAQDAQEGIQAVLNGSMTKFVLEYACDSPDTKRWFVMTVLPMLGTHQGVVVSHEDITERKLAEAALLNSQEQLRHLQKQEALGQLAGGMAHDFNNLLTAILGNAGLAMVKTGADHAARPHLARILEAGQRASHVVEQILTFTRQQDVAKTVISLVPIVTEALTLLRATLPAGVQLTGYCSPDTPPILANSTQIHQILMNLCTNAWHALGKQQGCITVDVMPVTLQAPLPSLSTTLSPGRYACLSVSDTGCGMSPDTMSRIFDPFFTTKRVGQGTGLGLSVVHGIVQDHKGAILVTSTPGQGTTFHLYFPETEGAPAQPIPDVPPPLSTAGRPRKRRILYVDDEEMLVELVHTTFEAQGYHVTSCTNPQEAIALVRANPHRFDAVITDFNMPSLSGVEVAREMSAINPAIPLVLVSGYLSPADHAAVLAAGIREVVDKPTMLRTLGGVLAKLLKEEEQDHAGYVQES